MNFVDFNSIDNLNSYDIIIVGAGFSGSVIARLLSDEGYKILLFDRRDHIGGNMYDYYENDSLIHKYGPHILYFDSKKVFDFLKKYGNFVKYKHKVYANINDNLITLPLTKNGIKKIIDEKYYKDLNSLAKKYKNKKISIFDLIKENKIIGDIVYNLVFKSYSEKMWGCDPMKLDKFVLERIPIYFKKTKNHFSNKYQFMPKNGYTNLFKNILDSDNIDVVLNIDINSLIEFDSKNILLNKNIYNGPLVYTGCISELFKKKYGELEYRSLDITIDFENKNFQKYSTINYPLDKYITRKSNMNLISQYRRFAKSNAILTEKPKRCSLGDEKMYPMPLKSEKEKYQNYLNESLKYKNLYLCGRLAEYRYINMENTIISAMDLAKRISEDIKKEA